MRRNWIQSVLVIATLVVSGCAGPLHRTLEQELRDQLQTAGRTYTESIADAVVIEITPTPSEVEAELTPEHRAELDRIGGPLAHLGVKLQLGRDLMGSGEVKQVKISLRHALHAAAKNNLDVQIAQMQPAIREATVTQAEAIFDAIYFANFEVNKMDTPLPPTTAGLGAFGSSQDETEIFSTGIRKGMASGGQLTLSTGVDRNFRSPSFFAINTYYTTNITLGLAQPLLRGFGEDVNRAQIELTRNARASDVQELRRKLVQVVQDTETGYWNLVLARHQLVIRQKLLERTIQDRDKIVARAGHDATPVEITVANSFVEQRRADIIRARNLVRSSSDTLKRLVNSSDLNVADETVLVPVDLPVELAATYSILDAVTTALRHRPEIQQVLLNIQDASIRQRVADNARLPQLDLAATIRFNGVGRDPGQSYDLVTDADFIDYLIGLQFEAPLGNRQAEGLSRQRELERRTAVIAYQNVAQQIVVDVKTSMRNTIDAFELIDANRGARLASADNMRALDARVGAGEALTPEFLDLRLRRMETLADDEEREVQALTGYQIAVSRLYQAMGTLLTRNGIDFSTVPVED